MRYAIVGCGSRHQMFRDALCGPYAHLHDLVALCDNNPERLALSIRQANRPIAGYAAGDFRSMIVQTRPDIVIVTTPDDLHAQFILAAFDAGCDVICEKPLTVDADALTAILAAQERTGRKLTVTFNYRYSPARTQIRELIAAGTIGRVTAVEFSWHLDRVHGADYFRRWHRQKTRSGGLFVHKATHHFDLLNWWLGSSPVQVTAQGARNFYCADTATSLGLTQRGARCTDCADITKCSFALDLTANDNLRTLYRDAETVDGYHRDACIFSDEVAIEDTLQAQISYASGASVNYTLTAFAPWEGCEVRFHGTKGQLYHRNVEVHGIFGGTRGAQQVEELTTQLHLAGAAPLNITIPEGSGDHGGADPLMLQCLFDEPKNVPPDPMARAADHRAGTLSVLTGLAANRAMEIGQPIVLDDLFTSP